MSRPFLIYYRYYIGYNKDVEQEKTDNKINRRGFLSLVLIGGITFAIGGVAGLFKGRGPKEPVLPENMKKAAYWRRIK